MSDRGRPPWGRLVAAVVVVALLVPLAIMWWSSRVPSTYSVMDMGVVDYGGGPGHAGHMAAGGMTSVADLTGPQTSKPDVARAWIHVLDPTR